MNIPAATCGAPFRLPSARFLLRQVVPIQPGTKILARLDGMAPAASGEGKFMRNIRVSSATGKERGNR